MVEVKAYLNADGAYVARKVEVKGEMAQGTPGAETKISGVVSSVDANQIVVNGQTILLDASTEIKGNLQVGSMVEVEAYLNADGTYVAKKVEVKDSGSNGEGEHEGNATPGWGEATSTPGPSEHEATVTPTPGNSDEHKDGDGNHEGNGSSGDVTSTPDLSGQGTTPTPTPTPDMSGSGEHDDEEHDGGH